jgi:hypothetical protein
MRSEELIMVVIGVVKCAESEFESGRGLAMTRASSSVCYFQLEDVAVPVFGAWVLDVSAAQRKRLACIRIGAPGSGGLSAC